MEIERRPTMKLEALFRARKPMILTDVVPHWSAFARWTPEFLASVNGDARVFAFTAPAECPEFTSANLEKRQVEMTVRDFIDRVFHSDSARQIRYYLWSNGRIVVGDDEWDTFLHDSGFPDEVDGRKRVDPVTGIWIGEGGNITALHHDPSVGLLAQIRGRKRVVLFSPSESAYLYPTSPFGSRPACANLRSGCDSADPMVFPNLAKANRFEGILGPGELLYIPSLWWHEVTGLEMNISAPIRYAPRWWEVIRPEMFAHAVRQWRLLHDRPREATVLPSSGTLA